MRMMLTLDIIVWIVARCERQVEQPYMRAPARYCLYRMPMLAIDIQVQRAKLERGLRVWVKGTDRSWSRMRMTRPLS